VRHVGNVITYGPNATRRIISPKLLKTSINNGYLVVYLSIPGSRKAQVFYVEKAVRASFSETTTLPESLPDEVWRDIRGYEGLYRVSNIGRVMSLSRIIDDGQGRNRFIRPRIREPIRQIGRYPEVMLAKDGCIENILVHRLVAKAFIPNPKRLPVVHHKDEDKSNNRVENLEWTTAQGNVRDWFDARSHRIDETLIEHIAAASATGKTPAEILAALPKRRKAEKIN
jgi:HNH endonuclease/NUMOD4 motif